MLRVRASFMALSDRCSVLVFHIAAVFALIHSCRGQSEVVGPLQPVVALIGDDIMLPCNLDPVMDAFGLAVEWARPDLDPRFVLVSRDGVDLESKKHPSYTSRTSLFTDELKNGNISLKISKVKLSDEGTYRCLVPELNRHTTVQLVVGAASSPAAEINSTISSSRVVLQCESAGWYPEPELLWLDGEGNLLSAGPTETLRGPDDLYTVSSRVTVEKRHSNNITCRVQQRNTNQSRETHIHVPDHFFVVTSPHNNPANDPTIIIGLVIGTLVVLILILIVSFVVWKKRRAKGKKKKSEEDGGNQASKKNKISSKNDNCGSQDVEGEREPLMTGREEQRHEDERETKQDGFVLETERIKYINCGQEKRINPSNDKESLIIIEQETPKEQEVTGREEEEDVENSGEKNFKVERETQQDDHETETEQRSNTESSGTKTSTVTETEPDTNNVDIRGEQRNKDAETQHNQHVRETVQTRDSDRPIDNRKNPSTVNDKESLITIEQETQEEQEVTGREEEDEHETNNVDIRGERRQQEQLVEKRQMGRNVDMKESDTEKKRAEENRDGVNNLYPVFMAQKETQREKLEGEQQREENQRRLQSETRREREKDERELKIRKDNKNQHHTEEKTVRKTQRIKKRERENQRDKMGMRERKREEQRSQTESRVSSVSNKVPLNTDLKIQDKARGQNQEKQPEETSQQSREEIREQPEKLRGAERKEGGQGEELEVHGGLRSEETNRKDKEREKLQLPHEGELQAEQQVNVNEKEQPEESVSVTERGVDCVEEKQEEEPMEVDIQSRKHTQEMNLQEVCTVPVNKEEIQARKQNFKEVIKCVNKQNDQSMEVDDAAHSQNAATAQLYETNYQQKLPVQTEPQECLKESVEDLEDLMEAEGYSGLQFPPFTEEHKEEPMSLGEEKSFNFSFHLSTDQEARKGKETQEQLVENIQMERNVDIKKSDTDKQRGQTESRVSSVSSKVPLNTDLKIQDKTRGHNQEKQPQETSQQSREEIREQPEKLRGAERKGGGQGEELEVHEGLRSEETNRKDKEREKLQLPHEGELQVEQQVNVNEKEQPEESVSVTERGVDCEEEKQEEELLEVDIQSRKHTQEMNLQEVCTVPAKRQKVQEERRASKHQNFKKPKKYVNKQNDGHMEADYCAHSHNAATAQLYETKDQQKLSVQTKPQGCWKESVEDLEDQMETDALTDEQSIGRKCLKRECVLEDGGDINMEYESCTPGNQDRVST